MKKYNKVFITMAVLISLLATACSVQTETSESYTDANGNTTTTTTKNDNGAVTTETTSSANSEEEEPEGIDEPEEAVEPAEADEPEEAADVENNQASDIPDDVTQFAETLRTAIAKQGINVTINDPADSGDGKYSITTGTDKILFAVQTDGNQAQSYTVSAMGDDLDSIKGAFSMLIASLLEGDEMNETGEAIVTRGETPVETEAYTFTAVTGEIGGQSFSTLTAAVK